MCSRAKQVYAAKQGQPLDAAQTARAREVVAAVAGRFAEERIQTMARAIGGLL